MAEINKNITVKISPLQFLLECSNEELLEIELLISFYGFSKEFKKSDPRKDAHAWRITSILKEIEDMVPTTPKHSDINLLQANIRMYTQSDLFTEEEKESLIKPLRERLELLKTTPNGIY